LIINHANTLAAAVATATVAQNIFLVSIVVPYKLSCTRSIAPAIAQVLWARSRANYTWQRSMLLSSSATM
jgi:hypothetical protein